MKSANRILCSLLPLAALAAVSCGGSEAEKTEPITVGVTKDAAPALYLPDTETNHMYVETEIEPQEEVTQFSSVEEIQPESSEEAGQE